MKGEIKLGRKLLTAFDRVLDIMAVLAAGLLVLIMLFVCMDALGRYFFDHPFIWVTQASEYSLLYITFMGAAWLLRREGHVMMDIVVDRLRTDLKALLGVLSSAIGAVIFTVLMWYGFAVALDHLSRGVYDPSIFEVPKAPIIAIIPVGSLLLVIQFVRRGYRHFVNLRRHSDRSESGSEHRGATPGMGV